jgi:hypothetical protein
MKKFALLLFGTLLLFGIVGLLLPDSAQVWAWGGFGGGGWRPPRDRPGGGSGGGSNPRPPGGGATPPGTRPGAGAPGAGAGAGSEGLTELQKNQEFDFEFIEDKEIHYHRQSVGSLFEDKE